MAAICSGNVIDAVSLPHGDVCLLFSETTETEATTLKLCRYRPLEGVLWSLETPPVRADAAQGVLGLTPEGKIITAVQINEGYTDIFIGTYSQGGELLHADTLTTQCYDEPQTICSTEEGMVLAWDSWSEERGVHLATIDEEGVVTGKHFITPTAHPMNIAMDHNAGLTVVGVSPLAAEDDVLFGINENGSVLWSVGTDCGLPDEASMILDIALEEDGGFQVLWNSGPAGGEVPRYVVTTHLAGGEVLEKVYDPVFRPDGIYALNLLRGGELLQAGYFFEEEGYHVTRTDLSGNPAAQLTLPSDFTFQNVKPWDADGYIVYGFDGLQAVTGNCILAISLREY